MKFHSQRLDNGLQIIGETSPTAHSLSLGFFVRTGSRDETPDVSGVTHFLEHMVFKGTPRRTALEVNADFDRMGASYNAYTSEENTVFYATILPEYMPNAVDLLADILRPSLREEDFDMEKGVIINEIGEYEDMPMYHAYDLAKQEYFAEHPLGCSILGTRESINALTRDQMHAYFQKRYVPSNITVAAAGNYDWLRLVKLIEQHCGDWPASNAPREGVTHHPGSGRFNVVPKEKVHQQNVILMSPAPAADSPLLYASELLATIVGDDSGSRLYWALVDLGLVDYADMSYSEYIGTGVFYTLFCCDPDKTQDNLERVYKLLGEVQTGGVTDEELQQAKNKYMARMVRGSERSMGRMRAIGGTWTALQEYHTLDEELNRLDAVTTETVRQLLDQFPLNQLTAFALGPLTELKQP